MEIAAVTGLAAEARLLERRGIRVIATAGNERRTAEACAQLLAEGARALLSFGVAGALAPGLAPGTLILPRRVRDERGTVYDADPRWHTRVLGALRGQANACDLLGRTAIAASAEDKAALFRLSGAVAVDLESHIAAAAARRAGHPFLSLRAIADPASLSLPPAAAVGLDEDGRAALWPVLRALVAEPTQLGALVRLACDTRAALKSLACAASAL